MILADTSVVIDGLRDDSARFWAALEARYPDETRWTIALPTRMEVLMGARNQQDWRTLEQYLERWERLPVHSNDWDEAARIYTDLRGIGITLGAMDCCIAQVALVHNALLLHRDRDFDLVAQVRTALRLERISAPPKR